MMAPSHDSKPHQRNRNRPITNREQLIREVTPLSDTISAVVFDFDGVVADTEQLHARAYKEVLERSNLHFDTADFPRYLGRTESEIWKLIAADLGTKIDAKEATSKRLTTFLKLAESEGLKPYSFLGTLLELLATKPLFIASSQQQWVVEELLGRWKLLDRFQRLLCAPNLHVSKKEILEDIGRYVGYAPPEVLLVEDSPTILSLAADLGFRTMGVAHSLSRNSQFHSEICVVVPEYVS